MKNIWGLTMVISIAAAAGPSVFGGPGQNGRPSPARTGSSQDEGQQLRELRGRLTDRRYRDLLSGVAWVLMHAADKKEEVEEFFKLLEAVGSGAEGDNPARLEGVGGASGFKRRLASLAKSKDDAVSASAAIMLGICGDRGYAADLAELLRKSDPPRTVEEEYKRPITARGRAAMALGLMGASEYAPELASLLGSKNDYDRAGAAMGLGYLGDKSYSRAVAALLESRDGREATKDSAISSLLLMGAAAEHADEIAKVLRAKSLGESAKTAAYTLAVIGAKEHAGDISRLLKQDYYKGDAAKALALMGATEYGQEIAAMLADASPLARKDAALALGVMRAKTYGAAVSKLLRDTEEYVRYYAAVAIVLMGVHDYDAVAVPIIDRFHEQGYHLNEGDFGSVARDQFTAINARFVESLARIKNRPQR